jgi:hypothetical protein
VISGFVAVSSSLAAHGSSLDFSVLSDIHIARSRVARFCCTECLMLGIVVQP